MLRQIDHIVCFLLLGRLVKSTNNRVHLLILAESVSSLTMAPSFTADDVVLLEMTIRGHIVLPENRVQYEYELSRMHNAVYHDRAPFFFVLCHDKEDVKNAIAFCTKHGAPISVRSGGHSACGSSCKSESVVIDTSRMRGLSYVSCWT